MKIKIISSPFLNYDNVIEKLKEFNFEIIQDDQEIEFNGRKINIGVFEQIKQRDGKNPQTVALYKILLEKQVENIENSDCVLILNIGNNFEISENMIFQSCIAYHCSIPIFIYYSIPYVNLWFEISQPMDFINIERNLEKIKSHMELIQKVKEEQNKIAHKVSKFIEEEVQKRGSIRPKLQTKE